MEDYFNMYTRAVDISHLQRMRMFCTSCWWQKNKWCSITMKVTTTNWIGLKSVESQ